MLVLSRALERGPLPPAERAALEETIEVMRVKTPWIWPWLEEHFLAREVLWGDCGPGAHACARLLGPTVTFARLSALSVDMRAQLIVHETLHLCGYDHDCSDELCRDPAEKARDFIYRYCWEYGDALRARMAACRP